LPRSRLRRVASHFRPIRPDFPAVTPIASVSRDV
jgi:hypothetical protein